jgi:hypothetical protein
MTKAEEPHAKAQSRKERQEERKGRWQKGRKGFGGGAEGPRPCLPVSLLFLPSFAPLRLGVRFLPLPFWWNVLEAGGRRIYIDGAESVPGGRE